MIWVSFSSTEDALSNDVKNYDIFGSQGNENLLLRFFWDTWYIYLIIYVFTYRTSLHGRGSKVAVVLIQKNAPLPPGKQENNMCKK